MYMHVSEEVKQSLTNSSNKSLNAHSSSMKLIFNVKPKNKNAVYRIRKPHTSLSSSAWIKGLWRLTRLSSLKVILFHFKSAAFYDKQLCE